MLLPVPSQTQAPQTKNHTSIQQDQHIKNPVDIKHFVNFTTNTMARKRSCSILLSPLYKNPKPHFLSSQSHHLSSLTPQQQQQNHISKVANDVLNIIRTKPRWEKQNTLLTHFPSFNFTDKTFFTEVLKQNQDNVFLSYRLYTWLVSLSGFSLDCVSAKLLFTSLVKAKVCVLAKQFLDDMTDIFKPDPDELECLICCLCDHGHVDCALDLFVKVKSFGFCPCVRVWNSALEGAVRVKRTDVVWRLYGDMLDSGVSADADSVGYLIQAFCIDGNVEKAYELLREVRDSGVVVSNVAMTKLISGFSREGSYDRVSELLHLMIGTGRNPDIYTYQEVIHGLCKRGKAAEGYRIFDTLKSRGYAPDRVMYTTMIHGLCEMRWVGEARKLWSEMVRKGILPNEYTYSVLIHGYCRIYAVDEALKLRKEMCDRGYKLNTVVYNTLIGGLCINGMIEEASGLFEEMTSNGIDRDVITYNSLIRGLCRFGNPVKGRMLLDELVAQGLQPSNSSYTPLIEQLSKAGSTQQALELLTDMVNRGVEPSVYNRECIIAGFCNEGFPMEGMQWLSDMLEMKLIPRRKVFETLIECLSQHEKLDATLLVVNSMLSMGYMLGEMVSYLVVSKLCGDNLKNVETHLQDIMSGGQVSEICS